MKTWLRLETREEVEGRAAFLRERQIEGMKFWNSCLSCLPSKQENLAFAGFMGNKAELEVLSFTAPTGRVYMAAQPELQLLCTKKKVSALLKTWVWFVKKTPSKQTNKKPLQKQWTVLALNTGAPGCQKDQGLSAEQRGGSPRYALFMGKANSCCTPVLTAVS